MRSRHSLKSPAFGKRVDDGLVEGASLAGCGKTIVARWKFNGPHVWDNRITPRRMLKKAVQQGRSERRGEEVRTALRVGRLPLEWILANG